MSYFIPRHGLATLTVVVACVSFTRLACAQEAPSTASTPWGLGIGVVSSQRPYAGADNKTIPFPLITYENEYVRIAGVGADLKLGSSGPVRFALHVNYALSDGYKSGDAPILNGMATRDGSLWLGPSVQWNAGVAKVSFELLGDALGKSKGVQARLGIDHDFRLGSFMLTPHVAAQFVDGKYVDYYYGVTAAEATAQRPAYAGKSTVNVEAGVRTTFAINQTNTVFADLGVKALGSGVTDSPLVDRKVTPGIVLGYSFRY